MSRFNEERSGPIIDAAHAWVRSCLVEDGSVFSAESLWTRENFNELDRHFVQRLDAGEGSFYEKLQAQLVNAPASAKRLMAEVLWALFLFPSNISIEMKRSSLLKVWGWSGESLDPAHLKLADDVLAGIGSGGMGVNNHRWRELVYMIGMGAQLKAMPHSGRAPLFTVYDRFSEWIDQVPQDGERQFRQMLRYFLFPDRVERMSSNGDRKKILIALGLAKKAEVSKWSDRQLDDALLEIRRQMEAKYETQDLDFYVPPLRELWMPDDTEVESAPVETKGNAIAESNSDYLLPTAKPRNLIFYGPPGTGKTWRLQKLFDDYTDQPADVDRATWALQLVARYGWRAAIAAALAEIGRPVRVLELEEHPLIKAKAAQRKRVNSVRASLWGYLQEHTPPDVTTVNVSVRRPPFVFIKNADSEWSLVPDWKEVDAHAEELWAGWRAGPGSAAKAVQRYRVVTFHPSYSYEDFVIGLRPVALEDSAETGASGFRMVDGVFKQICAEARANAAKRYALFIDEINRANIAKVFGELITLVEPDKRTRYDASGTSISGMEVQLPGTSAEEGDNERFGVPDNLDIYGTMNTADRSIALLDIALRRRFEFEEIPPDYRLLDHRVEGVDLGKLLSSINDRLEFLADRDRRIGHSFFMRVTSLDDLRDSFRRQVIPLLQEYFFDDWGRVELVFSGRNGRSTFIRREALDGAKLFVGAADMSLSDRVRHEVTLAETWTAEAFRSIYEEVTVVEPVLA